MNTVALGDLLVVVAGGALLTGVTVLAHVTYRRFGLVPLISLMTLFSLAIPAWAWQASPPISDLVRASNVTLTLLPALLVGVLIAYASHGGDTARAMSLLPFAGGLVIAVSAWTPLPIPLLPPADSLSTTPGGAIFMGSLVSLTAFVATAGFGTVARFTRGGQPAFAVLAGGVTGLLLFGGIVMVSARVGGPELPGSDLGRVIGPLALSIIPLTIGAIEAAVATRHLTPFVRTEVFKRPIFGAASLMDEAEHLRQVLESAKKEAKKTESAYKGLIETTQDGIYLARPDGLIQYANHRLSMLVDEPDVDLSGRNVRYIFPNESGKGSRPELVKPGRHRITGVLATGKRRTFDVLVTVGEKGTPEAGLLRGQVRDVTEAILREQLAERTERAEFYVHLLRHDIGNYISPPITNVEILLMDDEMDQEARQMLESSQRSLAKIHALLRQVDALAAIDQVQPEPIDVLDIMRQVGEHFQATHADDVTLTLDMPDDPMVVNGLPILGQVFVNLLGNAVRHVDPPVHIWMRAERDGKWGIFSVEDNGPGVPEEIKDTLFDYGRRREGSVGKGLGLYIVRTIVRSLGGEAIVSDRVRGDPSQGAAFRVRLPLSKDRPRPPEQAPAAWEPDSADEALEEEDPDVPVDDEDPDVPVDDEAEGSGAGGEEVAQA